MGIPLNVGGVRERKRAVQAGGQAHKETGGQEGKIGRGHMQGRHTDEKLAPRLLGRVGVFHGGKNGRRMGPACISPAPSKAGPAALVVQRGGHRGVGLAKREREAAAKTEPDTLKSSHRPALGEGRAVAAIAMVGAGRAGVRAATPARGGRGPG